jgi:PPOX class probable F420-dependent enzyme
MGATEDDALLALVGDRGRGVLATIRADGRPQMSTVDYAFDPSARVVRLSTTSSRAKVRNLLRDPRAGFHVAAPGGDAYAVLECSAAVSAPAVRPDDAVADQLVEVYRAIRGDHPDWTEYRAVMVDDARVVVSLAVERLYGWLGSR